MVESRLTIVRLRRAKTPGARSPEPRIRGRSGAGRVLIGQVSARRITTPRSRRHRHARAEAIPAWSRADRRTGPGSKVFGALITGSACPAVDKTATWASRWRWSSRRTRPLPARREGGGGRVRSPARRVDATEALAPDAPASPGRQPAYLLRRFRRRIRRRHWRRPKSSSSRPSKCRASRPATWNPKPRSRRWKRRWP